MRLLGIVLLLWMIYDVSTSVICFLLAAKKIGWVKLLGGIKKTKKEFLKRIIYPLIGTLLTIYYIVATLEAMK